MALAASSPTWEYASTVGPTRDHLASHGAQPGDPVKAARAILTALDAPTPPLRLARGGDAILEHLDHRQAEIQE